MMYTVMNSDGSTYCLTSMEDVLAQASASGLSFPTHFAPASSSAAGWMQALSQGSASMSPINAASAGFGPPVSRALPNEGQPRAGGVLVGMRAPSTGFASTHDGMQVMVQGSAETAAAPRAKPSGPDSNPFVSPRGQRHANPTPGSHIAPLSAHPAAALEPSDSQPLAATTTREPDIGFPESSAESDGNDGLPRCDPAADELDVIAGDKDHFEMGDVAEVDAGGQGLA
jgi:hypothetical protein